MTNAEYWKQRFTQLEAAQNRKGATAYLEMEKQYKAAQNELEAQIARWYQRFADSNGISLAQAKQWLKGHDLAEFKWDVKEYIKYGKENAINGAWMQELENASSKFHISRLEALQIQTQNSLETMFAQQMGTMKKALSDVYASGYYHTAYAVQQGFGLGWDIAGLDQAQIEKVLSKPWAVDGYNFSTRIWNSKTKLIGEVHNELSKNLLTGADPQKAIDSLAKKMGTSKSNAGRLVMTEQAYFSSAAQKDCFNDLDVEEYEIVATLDSHTSDICRSLDGKVFKMSDYKPGVTAPPFHVYCRSTTAPHFKDNFDAGERAAREADGKTYYVPDDVTYSEWKKAFVDGDKSGFAEVKHKHYKREEPKQQANPRDYNCDMAQKVGKNHFDNIRDKVDGCQNDDLRTVWNTFESQIKVADAHYHGRSFASGGTINITIGSDAKGNSYNAPYAVTFHESGHAIDCLTAPMGGKSGQWFISSSYKDGLFPKTIKAEVSDWVNAVYKEMKAHKDDFQYWIDQNWIDSNTAAYYSNSSWFKMSKSLAYKAIQNQLSALNWLQKGDISDILEGATRTKICLGVGHGAAYWTNRVYDGIDFGLGTEAFAEMTSASMTCPESLAVIQKYLPKSYAVYKEIIKMIAENV